MPPQITFDHNVIKVSDFAISDAFYSKVLGVEISAPVEGFRTYKLGAQQLNVHGPGLKVGPEKLAKNPVAAGNSDIAFEWHGPIEEALAHLEACGVESHTGIVETHGCRGKGRSVYFRDPDGSLLEFITYPDSAD
ncbi:MAG: VOC family protein [Sphingobium sp.]